MLPRFALALCSILLTFGLAEVAARVFGLAAPVMPQADTAMVLHYTDPNGLVRLTPNWEGYVAFVKTRINEKGFRDRVFSSSPPPATVRIAVLGDSYTMGDAVPLEATYPKQLEALLAAQGKTEVMNCGVSATNTSNQLAILTEILRDYRPHMVVLAYNVNDFEWYEETRFQHLQRMGYSFEIRSDGRVNLDRNLSRMQKLKRWVYDHSYLHRWLAAIRRAWQSRGQMVPGGHETFVQKWVASPGPSKSFEALRQMKELLDAHGTAFELVVIPGLLDIPPSIARMDDYPFRAEHELIQRNAQGLGIDVVDLVSDFAVESRKSLLAHPFDWHFNQRGNAIIAQALERLLDSRIRALRGQLSEQSGILAH